MALGAPLTLVALLALAKGGAPSAAEPIPIRVEFDAPAGCSSAEAFYAGVAARSERTRRAAPGEEATRLGVRVTRAGGKVFGELRLLDGKSDLETRRVEGVRCDEVVEVLSLTAALALDPTARMGPLPPSAPATPPPTGAGTAGPSGALPVATVPPPAPTPPPAPPPALAPPKPEVSRIAAPMARLEVIVGAEVVAARVLAPTVSFGGGLSVRLARRRADAPARSVELSGAYLVNDPWSSDDEVVVHWAAFTATVCPGWGILTPRLGIDLCAQAVGGWLNVTDRVVTIPASVGRFWGSAGAMVRLGIPIGAGFALEAAASLGLPFVERRFITTTPEETVGTTPSVVLAGAIGIARNF